MDIYDFLNKHKIEYQQFDHPAVFTCEEAERLCPKMPGASIKNLFLRDREGAHHFLVIVGKDKKVNLKKLAEFIKTSKLSFASPERLQQYLGVEPGAVTLLGLINDPDHKIELIIDEKIWGQPLQCHPLVNTATLVISHEDLGKFFKLSGHEPRIISI